MNFKKEQVLNELQKIYPTAKVCFSLKEIPDKNNLPDEWLKFFAGSFEKDGIKPLAEWNLIKNQLPNVYAFVTNYVFACALLIEDNDNLSLLYLYSTENGKNLNFYKGGLPLTKKTGNKIVDKFPPLLSSIYSHLHNGWAFIPGESAGFQPLEYCSFLTDDKFDIDEKVIDSYEFSAKDTLTIYHNGAGDYLCLNLSEGNPINNKPEGIIWWHEEPENPEIEDNFWKSFDAWFYFAVENADLKDISKLIV